jgi:hypothetical protein
LGVIPGATIVSGLAGGIDAGVGVPTGSVVAAGVTALSTGLGRVSTPPRLQASAAIERPRDKVLSQNAANEVQRVVDKLMGLSLVHARSKPQASQQNGAFSR